MSATGPLRLQETEQKNNTQTKLAQNHKSSLPALHVMAWRVKVKENKAKPNPHKAGRSELAARNKAKRKAASEFLIRSRGTKIGPNKKQTQPTVESAFGNVPTNGESLLSRAAIASARRLNILSSKHRGLERSAAEAVPACIYTRIFGPPCGRP